jgi:hypothetical protein
VDSLKVLDLKRHATIETARRFRHVVCLDCGLASPKATLPKSVAKTVIEIGATGVNEPAECVPIMIVRPALVAV